MVQPKNSEEFTHLLKLWIDLQEKIQQCSDHSRDIERRLGKLLRLANMIQDDRRIHLRIPCKIPAMIRREDSSQETQTTVTDIGMGGVFCQSDAPVLVHEKLQITLTPDGSEPVCLQARSVWRKSTPPKGFGINFKGNTSASQNQLIKVIIVVLREVYEKQGSIPVL